MNETSKAITQQILSRRNIIKGSTALAGGLALAPAFSSATRVAANQTPASGAPTGELVVSLPARIVALDALGAQGAEESTRVAAAHIFDTLVIRDEETGEYLPSLATGWETPEPTSWIFTLRDDAIFHDGTPVGAADVVASLEYLLEAKGPLAPLWAALDTIEAQDDLTVHIQTTTPLGTILANVALLSVAPAAKINEEGFFNQPIGSGPFRVESYKPDQELVLEATSDYWGGAPGVQTLRFRDIPEISARVTALTTGEIDFTYQLPPDQLTDLAGNADLTITSKPSYRYYFIWLNAQTEAFSDVRVRQAMIHALDIPTISDALMQDSAELMDAPIPSTIFGYAPQTPYAYDPEKAKELLAEAGYEGGLETDMIWAPGSSPQDREIAQAMFSYWDAVGIKVTDRQSERAQWLDDLLALNWEMDFQTNGVVTGDADFVLRRLYHSSANRTGYANPDLDKLLDDAAASVDQEERKSLYADACKLIWDEAVGIYPFTLVQSFIARNNVQGFTPTASYPVFNKVTVE